MKIKRGIGFPRTELQMVGVSYHVGARKIPRSSAGARAALQLPELNYCKMHSTAKKKKKIAAKRLFGAEDITQEDRQKNREG